MKKADVETIARAVQAERVGAEVGAVPTQRGTAPETLSEGRKLLKQRPTVTAR
jgi:hypothetical protein